MNELAGTGNRSKSWVFTINNPTAEDLQAVLRTAEEKATYLIYGEEVGGREGTPHLQGYLQFDRRYRRRGVVQALGGRAWTAPAKGSPDQCRAYCKKEGSFHEYGTITCGEQGKRSDLLAIKKILDDGGSLLDVAQANFSDFVRYQRGFERYLELLDGRRNGVTSVYILWGDSGTGKSRTAHAFLKGAYCTYDDSLKWWCGYGGGNGREVIIDDFCGTAPFQTLLRLFDRYPYRVQTKGGSREFVAERIVITSNINPRNWYLSLSKEHVDAFWRRVTASYEFAIGGPLPEFGEDGLPTNFTLESGFTT